jgi:hypothetical protein
MSKQRYELAVYLLLVMLSVILALVAFFVFHQGSDGLQALLLNMSTELAGAVLIFFIVKRVFLLDREDELFKEIQYLKKQIKARFNPIIKEDDIGLEFFLKQQVETAQSIDLLGYNLVRLLRYIREPLVSAVRRGAKVRILLVDRNGEAGRVMSRSTSTPQMMTNDFEAANVFISDVEKKLSSDGDSKGSFEFHLTDWIPSCSMIIIKYGPNKGIARISIQNPSLRQPAEGRRAIVLPHPEYADDFGYFASQFDALWNRDSYDPAPRKSQQTPYN